MKSSKKIAYMDMARAISQLSPDKQTKVGAVLINPNGKQIASGYNGFVRGADDEHLPATRPEKYEFMQHAERNLIYNCVEEGIKTKSCVVVCTLSPCLECVRAMWQSGIETVIFDKMYYEDHDIFSKMKDLKVEKEIDSDTGFTILRFSPSREKTTCGVSPECPGCKRDCNA